MRFEPALGGEIIRAQALNFLPETGGMIHLPPVREFMQDDVVAHEVRRLDQAPVERDGAAPGT